MVRQNSHLASYELKNRDVNHRDTLNVRPSTQTSFLRGFAVSFEKTDIICMNTWGHFKCWNKGPFFWWGRPKGKTLKVTLVLIFLLSSITRPRFWCFTDVVIFYPVFLNLFLFREVLPCSNSSPHSVQPQSDLDTWGFKGTSIVLTLLYISPPRFILSRDQSTEPASLTFDHCCPVKVRYKWVINTNLTTGCWIYPKYNVTDISTQPDCCTSTMLPLLYVLRAWIDTHQMMLHNTADVLQLIYMSTKLQKNLRKHCPQYQLILVYLYWYKQRFFDW